MPLDILGISAYYHDSAACLLRDGEIVAAAQEERFSRKRHDAGFPVHAIGFCLRQGGMSVGDLKYVAFYDKPLLKFERLLETYLAFAPRGIRSFLVAMPVWVRDKLMLKRVLEDELLALAPGAERAALPPLLFDEHHESHAASAFYPSPFERAAVLCLDGVGEWATTSAWMGEGSDLTPLWDLAFPHSIGLLYSAFTYHAGFRVNSGEYKVMGLAPYGEPTYVRTIYDNLIDLKPDGTFRLNLDYFDYCTGLTMTNDRFDRLFGGSPRVPEGPLTRREMDLARSIQEVTGEVMLRLARTLGRETGADCLSMAGGVALNSVGNGRIVREGPFRNIWIQPAAGDAGGAVGAACAAWHGMEGQPRRRTENRDAMRGGYLGPAFGDQEIESFLGEARASSERLDDAALFRRVASELASGKVVGWFQGPMEFGPRALGNRSILGDPRDANMRSVLNDKIKRRESFRPFAPAVSGERAGDYFEMDAESPYMTLVAPVRETRSDIPAVTHVDRTARVQTVHRTTNPRFHALLEAFRAQTGCAVVVNTSFNVRGEPIVCTPGDAYRCFMKTAMDVLVLENYILDKDAQAPWVQGSDAAPAQAATEEKAGARQLRSFGLIAGTGFAVIGLWPLLLRSEPPRSWALALALALGAAGLAFPPLLRKPYRFWMALGAGLGWINTRIVLGLVYYGLVVPIGLAMRIIGRDAMRRGFDKDSETYRILRSKRPASHMRRQY